MPYLNFDLDYFDHPKTKRLIGMLGKGSEVLPVRVWVFCGKFYPERGRLAGYSAHEIESIVGWWGKPGEMMEAMVKVGFMEHEGQDFVVHDWKDHAGHLIEFKKRAQVAAKARWDAIGKKSAEDQECSKHATSNAKSVSKQCSLPTLPNQPNQEQIPEAGPPKPLTPLQVFLAGIATDYWGLKPGNPDPAERGKVNAAYKRHSRAGKDVLDMAGGDPKQARRGVDAVGKRMQKGGLSWTLDTVCQHFLDWQADPGGYERETERTRSR